MSNTRVTNQAEENLFYRAHFHKTIMVLIVTILLLVCLVILVLYQVHHRPLPPFKAIGATSGQQMMLLASNEPNLMPSTIIKWASKAAVDVYTYNFVQTDNQIYTMIKPYFTYAAGIAFYKTIQPVIKTLRQNQLITNCTVSGPPVISNQGELPGRGLSWRVQIPFLVTYQSAESSSTRAYRVTLIIIKVPTTENPAGIAIDQFLM